MLVDFKENHKEHLSLLLEKTPENYCNLSISFLQNGFKKSEEAYENLAQNKEEAEKILIGLTHLLLIGCKNKLSEADFRDSILTLGFDENQQAVLTNFYLSKNEEIYNIASKTLNIPSIHYENMEWRLDLQIGSRSLLHQSTPSVTLQIKTQKKQGIENKSIPEIHHFSADLNNLIHIREGLEAALAESKSRNSRRIQRTLKD